MVLRRICSLLCLVLSAVVLPVGAGATAPTAVPAPGEGDAPKNAPKTDACLEAAIAVPGTVLLSDDDQDDDDDGEHEDDPLAPCQGIRPGGALILRAEPFEFVYCSLAFLVTDGTHVYATTAGHCVAEEFGVPTLGEQVSAHGVPGTFGEVVYQWCEGEALNGGCGAGSDFALIRIDTAAKHFANPAMCTWGAPSGIFTASDETPRELRHFGWGLGFGGGAAGVGTSERTIQPGNPATQARRSIGFDFSRSRAVLGAGAAVSGDSGSGVLVSELPELPSTDQPAPRALGILTHLGAGTIVIQRLDASLAKAGEAMGKTFTLWTGP